MTVKKKLAAIMLLAALALTGCTSGTADKPGTATYGWYAEEVTLPDGSKVMCVATSNGGVSCDWAR